jgi:hypothetical protein
MTAPSPHALRTEGGVAAARACAASPRGGGAVARREALAAGFGASLLTLMPSEACADMTLNSFKRAYFRWVPRIEAGRDFFVLELGAEIEGEEWDKVPRPALSCCAHPPVSDALGGQRRGARGNFCACSGRRMHVPGRRGPEQGGNPVMGKRKGVPNTEVACACLASPRGTFPCRTRQVLKAFELTIVAQEGSARAQNGIAEKSTRVDRDLLTPLKVLASVHLMLDLFRAHFRLCGIPFREGARPDGGGLAGFCHSFRREGN